VDERQLLADIERLLKTEIRLDIVAGFDPDPRIKAEPIQNGRGQQSGRHNPRRHVKNGNSPPGHRGSRGRSFSTRRRAGA
jgi:ATP-dependent RNA helicase RhlE